VLIRGEALLLKNERGEWELPGGRLEAGEGLRECVAREVREETGLRVGVGPLLDAYVYEVLPGARVLIFTYGCFAGSLRGVRRSAEHTDLKMFPFDDLARIELPGGYAASILAWSRHPANAVSS
jgi:8-oxo-dGTP pyrophosphatase MutT (NUDIX family)